jgi:hypothetical protein
MGRFDCTSTTFYLFQIHQWYFIKDKKERKVKEMKNPSGKNCSDEDKASDNKKQDGISSSSSSSSESDDDSSLVYTYVKLYTHMNSTQMYVL